MKRVALVAVVLCAVVAAQSARAQTDSAFACYSVWQTDPGAWQSTETTVFASWDAYASGYWAPFAETSVPTAEQVGRYYLTCTLPAGWELTGGYVLGNGSDVTSDAPYFVNAKAIPGVYPVIAPG
ncbi:MAG TPA: hypothetical protein VFW85_07795 [Gaiellaceae bacterium]|nr:hypothetical protein [Gaiellaceae bacterium]